MGDELLDDQDGDALSRERPDDLEQSLHDLRSEPLRHLVDHQDLRPHDQPAGDGEHLLLATRQGPGELRSAGVQRAEHAVHVVDPPVDLRPRDLGHGAGEAQRLLDLEVGEDPAALRDVDDPAARDLVRGAGERLAVETDLAGHQRQQPGQGAQRRRLAGSVGPEQGDDLALAYLEIDVEHDREAAVAGAETVGLEQCGHAAAAASPR